jgi:glutamine amidotransferase
MIGIVDYGLGNLLSVYNAFDYLGADVTYCRGPDDLSSVDKIVIPGVGAFKDCMDRLHAVGFAEALHEYVITKGKPTLGICLGMQIMAKVGFEFGSFSGLGWFEAEVIALNSFEPALQIPNIGWEAVSITQTTPLFRSIKSAPDFYFVHSFFMRCSDPNDIVAQYQYGNTHITAAVLKDNIFATQFHPEKSQDYGLKLLENFLDWDP